MDPSGEVIATIDNNGVCGISDVDTSECKFHQKIRRDTVFGK